MGTIITLPSNVRKSVTGIMNLTPGLWQEKSGDCRYFWVTATPRIEGFCYNHITIYLDTQNGPNTPMLHKDWDITGFNYLGDTLTVTFKV